MVETPTTRNVFGDSVFLFKQCGASTDYCKHTRCLPIHGPHTLQGSGPSRRQIKQLHPTTNVEPPTLIRPNVSSAAIDVEPLLKSIPLHDLKQSLGRPAFNDDAAHTEQLQVGERDGTD